MQEPIAPLAAPRASTRPTVERRRHRRAGAWSVAACMLCLSVAPSAAAQSAQTDAARTPDGYRVIPPLEQGVPPAPRTRIGAGAEAGADDTGPQRSPRRSEEVWSPSGQPAETLIPRTEGNVLTGDGGEGRLMILLDPDAPAESLPPEARRVFPEGQTGAFSVVPQVTRPDDAVIELEGTPGVADVAPTAGATAAPGPGGVTAEARAPTIVIQVFGGGETRTLTGETGETGETLDLTAVPTLPGTAGGLPPGLGVRPRTMPTETELPAAPVLLPGGTGGLRGDGFEEETAEIPAVTRLPDDAAPGNRDALLPQSNPWIARQPGALPWELFEIIPGSRPAGAVGDEVVPYDPEEPDALDYSRSG